MPTVSKAQLRLMKGIASGSIKPRKGLPSKQVAKEFTNHDSPKGLPEKKHKKK